MDLNWKGAYEKQQRIDFYQWICLWYNEHFKRPRIIVARLKYRSRIIYGDDPDFKKYYASEIASIDFPSAESIGNSEEGPQMEYWLNLLNPSRYEIQEYILPEISHVTVDVVPYFDKNYKQICVIDEEVESVFAQRLREILQTIIFNLHQGQYRKYKLNNGSDKALIQMAELDATGQRNSVTSEEQQMEMALAHMVCMYTLYRDWLGRETSSGKYFLNDLQTEISITEPLITMENLFDGYPVNEVIEPVHGDLPPETPPRFKYSMNYEIEKITNTGFESLITTVYTQSKEIKAFNDIPPEWFKLLPKTDKFTKQTDVDPDTDNYKFQLDGDFCSIRYGGTVVPQLKKIRGFQYIAELLKQPNMEIHVLDLVHSVTKPESLGVEYMAQYEIEEIGSSSSQIQRSIPVMENDERVRIKQDLQEQINELQDAQADGQPGRITDAMEQIEDLQQLLKGSKGLGGRTRVTGSSDEKARTAVKKAIKLALDRIGLHNQALFEHFKESLQTGTFCSYNPTEYIPWIL